MKILSKSVSGIQRQTQLASHTPRERHLKCYKRFAASVIETVVCPFFRTFSFNLSTDRYDKEWHILAHRHRLPIFTRQMRESAYCNAREMCTISKITNRFNWFSALLQRCHCQVFAGTLYLYRTRALCIVLSAHALYYFRLFVLQFISMAIQRILMSRLASCHRLTSVDMRIVSFSAQRLVNMRRDKTYVWKRQMCIVASNNNRLTVCNIEFDVGV